MSVNKYLPYIFVLPEDDTNRQIANGFQLNVDKFRQMQVLPVAGGWGETLSLFETVHINEMERDENRMLVLVFDFDGKQNRLERARAVIPAHLTARVFVLGVFTEPEDLRASLRPAGLDSYEKIGTAMAVDCRNNTDDTWSHELLRHNSRELERLRGSVVSMLFNLA